MSLLVASCTMGKQPDRLLDKGPQYLRTRTNSCLFGQTRKSAVELLAASKPQFYNSRTSEAHDHHQDLTPSPELDILARTWHHHQDLASSPGQNTRFCTTNTQREPPRSKSEHYLSKIETTNTEDSDDCAGASINIHEGLPVQEHPRPENQITVQHINKYTNKEAELISYTKFQHDFNLQIQHLSEDNKHLHLTSKPELNTSCYGRLSVLDSEKLHENLSSVNESEKVNEISRTVRKKPVPLPRKFKIKPVPAPRKPPALGPEDRVSKVTDHSSSDVLPYPRSPYDSPASIGITTLSTFTPEDKVPTLTDHIPTDVLPYPCSSLHPLEPNRITQLSVFNAWSPPSTDSETAVNKKETLTKGAVGSTSLKIEPKIVPTSSVEANRSETESTPVDCGISIEQEISSKGKQGVTSGDGCSRSETFLLSCDHTGTRSDKRCLDLSISSGVIKIDRSSDTSSGYFSSAVSKFFPVKGISHTSTTKSEMSIESVHHAICESEVSAIPSSSLHTDIFRDVDRTREVTRSNSSLSGKLEQQSLSPLSLSPTSHCQLVPRSHSDIGCHSESQHAQVNSLASKHKRLSRASVGADLENFFNQMGLEREVLEHANTFQELHSSENFGSVSSLDSQDAVYSRSEKERSESPQHLERCHQQTSVVERNARIIKWLCNVRKAKTQPTVPDSKAESKP